MAVTETLSDRTFGNDDQLPRVPVPTLGDSCARFLEWCAPLLTADELAETERAVAAFQASESPAHELQEELERYDKQDGVHSWLDTFWPYRYLGRRDRIALNANFFFLFGDSPLGQLPRAAALITAAVDYKLRLDDERIAPIVLRGQPLSMAQNKYLFATTRIPGAVQDTVRAPYSAAEPGPAAARHVIVFRAGRPFRLDVLASDGRPYSSAALADGLAEVVRQADALGRPDASVGDFTTMARAEWAATRQALIDQGNTAALDTIETALFCVCLDDATPADTQQACDLLLHGDSGNRWFDKAVSFVVFADGTAGINIEHCELDGTTILAFVDDLLAGTPEQRPTAAEIPTVATVEFVLDAELAATARKARAEFADYAAATATRCVAFPDFGANHAKQLGMSPDAFAQAAYQLAHRRAKGVTGATYESIATRQFRRGRTEAMRVVTPEMVAFADAMTDPAADRDTRRGAFRAAAAKHVVRAKECQAGAAPEQHLWELQLIQRRRGGDEAVLALYDSPGWRIMRDDYLSTSSAPSTNIQFFGFGSTSPQCIGVAYVLLPDRLHVYLSTPRRVADEMHRFAEELRSAVAELAELLRE
jgi:carnitine O-acetyltransferase